MISAATSSGVEIGPTHVEVEVEVDSAPLAAMSEAMASASVVEALAVEHGFAIAVAVVIGGDAELVTEVEDIPVATTFEVAPDCMMCGLFVGVTLSVLIVEDGTPVACDSDEEKPVGFCPLDTRELERRV